MQPYFFPYLGYFSLIDASDLWVVFDDVQFIRHGWIDRNRIIDSSFKPTYIRPSIIKSSRGTKINEVYLNNSIDWKSKIFAQLTSYKKRAPYYSQVIDLLNCVFSKDFNKISDLNVFIIVEVCNYLGIPFNYKIYSELNLNIDHLIKHSGQWALEITKCLGASTYINPLGGRELFENKEFQNNSIELLFLENNLSFYNQKINSFEKGLSIIDVLMYNSIDETKTLVEDYNLLK